MSPSLLLSLSSKPFLRKLALRSNTLRMFSSHSTTTANPYLMYFVGSCGGEDFPEAGANTLLRVYDPAKEEYSVVEDKPYPKEMVHSKLVGSSQGWGLFLKSPSSVLMTDFCNPSSSKSNPKIIPLYPRNTTLKYCQSESVSGLAMSSSSPEQQDCMIVVKYTGRLVTIDTPGQDTKVGKLIFLPPRVFDYFQHAKLMYSKKDHRFYMVSDGGHHLWSLAATQSLDVHFHELQFHKLPRFPQSELQLLDSCHRTQQLVESPSGQRFLVKWYAQSPAKTSMPVDTGGTKRFMVFREEEDLNFCYTEDIGDLCMFLGNNEPFCVKASSFPGLIPNSIYFVGEGYGVYDIAARTPCSFNPKKSIQPSTTSNLGLCHWLPHWIPPFTL